MSSLMPMKVLMQALAAARISSSCAARSSQSNVRPGQEIVPIFNMPGSALAAAGKSSRAANSRRKTFMPMSIPRFGLNASVAAVVDKACAAQLAVLVAIHRLEAAYGPYLETAFILIGRIFGNGAIFLIAGAEAVQDAVLDAHERLDALIGGAEQVGTAGFRVAAIKCAAGARQRAHFDHAAIAGFSGFRGGGRQQQDHHRQDTEGDA